MKKNSISFRLALAFGFSLLVFLLTPVLAQAQTAKKKADKIEDVKDREEDVRDRKENRADRRENRRDRKNN